MSAHTKTRQMPRDIKADRLSGVASRCPDTVHDVGTLSDVKLWKGGACLTADVDARSHLPDLVYPPLLAAF